MSSAKEEGLDSLLGQVNVAISFSYGYSADYSKSAEHSFEAIRIARIYHDTVTLMDAFNNLGIDFLYQDQYDTSEDYFRQVIDLAVATKDSLRWAHALNNLGLIKSYQGYSQEELTLYNQAKEIFNWIEDFEGYANTIMNIGTVHTELAQYDLADAHYTKALRLFEELAYASAICHTLQSMAENAQLDNRKKEAESLAQKALKVALENLYAQDVLYTYDLLHKINTELSDYEQAYQYLTLHSNLKDSLFNLQKSEQINMLQSRYEADQKEAQIKILTAENELSELSLKKEARERWIIIISALLILLLCIYVLIISYKRYKLKNDLLARETDNLRLKIKGILEGNIDAMGVSLEVMNTSIEDPLSEREFEILSLALTDVSNSEIAEKTFVSVNTVKYHLKNIYEKLGVSNRKEAMQFALRSTRQES